MTTYVTYQCSICRRTKDIEQDNFRALPNQCTITKGCSGTLSKIGDTAIASAVDPVNGLTDWYPRGKKIVVTEAPPVSEQISMSCSETGTLTLAVFMTNAEAASNPTLKLIAKQRLSADVPSTEYVYTVAAPTTIISGKDSTGKNLRFDQAAIDDGRVQVLVNGVIRTDYIATPNVITFATPLAIGSIVEVTVFGIAPTTPQTLEFVANYSFIASESAGSWANIRWVDEYNPTTGDLESDEQSKKWWIYSCSSLSNLSASSILSIVAIKNSAETVTFSTARFLIAAPPYDSTDRYLNFYIDVTALSNGYLLSSVISSITELYAQSEALIEIYPPFQLIHNSNMSNSSYVVADRFPTTDSVSMDEDRLIGKKIIGPL